MGGKGRFYVRPYAEKFLEEMTQLYELTIFTAAVQDVINTIFLLITLVCRYSSEYPGS
jgi:hypothetical protein